MNFTTKEQVIDYLRMYEELHFDRIFCMNKATSVHGIDYSKDTGGTFHRDSSTIEFFSNKAIDDEKRMNEIEKFVSQNFSGVALNVIWCHFIEFKTYEEILDELISNGSKISHVDTLYKKQRTAIERFIKNGSSK